MSRSTQDKFEQAMEGIAHVYRMEVINDREYSNTGWLSFQPVGNFNVIGRFYYSFQSTYASFEGTIGKIEFKRSAVRPAEMQDLVDYIRASVASEYPRQDP